MTALRTGSTSFEQLAAEIAAIPFASEAALRRPFEALDPTLPDDLHGTEHATAQLWRAAERELCAAFPGFSIDELVHLRDRAWFLSPNRLEPVPLAAVLARVASLRWERATTSGPALDTAAQESSASTTDRGPTPQWLRAIRWLQYALPGDLLQNFAARPNAVDGTEAGVPPSLESLLRSRGFAEVHLHVGAGLRFPELWELLRTAIQSPEFTEDQLRAPGAYLDDGRHLSYVVLVSLLLEQILGVFLRLRGALPPTPGTFREYFVDWILPTVAEHHGGHMAVELRNAVFGLACGDVEGRLSPATFSNLQGIARDLLSDQGEPSRMASLYQRAAAYLAVPPIHADPFFDRALWQAVRGRNLLFRHVVQRPRTPGLSWFVRFYERLRKARGKLDEDSQLRRAAAVSGAGRGLRDLEVRTACFKPSEVSEWAGRLAGLVASPPGSQPGTATPARASLVFHLIRDRGGAWKDGLPGAFGRGSYHEPTGRPLARDRPGSGQGGPRLASAYRELQTQALAIGQGLGRHPAALAWIRGLDACSDEPGVPNWVLVPPWRYVVSCAQQAARRCTALGLPRLPGLRKTIHVGEDFLHLASGLRCLSESIVHLDLQQGDRLGHALALGIQAESWARSRGPILQRTEERLFDLVWEYLESAKAGQGAGTGRLAYLQQEVVRLLRIVLPETAGHATLQHAVDLYRDLFDPLALRNVGFPSTTPRGACSGDGSERLHRLRSYLYSPLSYFGAVSLQQVAPDEDAVALEWLSSHVRQLVLDRGLVVEVNPSSNLLIHDLSDLERHPLWTLSPIRDSSAPRIPIIVGSDDPVIFDSGLVDEYVQLHTTMRLAGVSEEDTMEWIDRVRARGLLASFSLDPPVDVDPATVDAGFPSGPMELLLLG